MILIFDTETSGLPTLAGGRYHLNPKKFDYYESSRIIEIGYAIYIRKMSVANGKLLKRLIILLFPMVLQ